jgi:type IV pilus assembly protein PilO
MNATPAPAWRERLASPLTWHYAVFAVLLVTVIVLAIRFAMDWAATSSRTADAVANKQVQLHALEIQTAPLRGLDKRIAVAHDEVKSFITDRIPASYSSISAEMGNLEVKSGVRQTRLSYAQKAPENNLTEITLDAGITGEYPQIMKFVNSLERDNIFFVIRGMGLTGQQGGMVNLRLQLSTWLRPEDAAASGLPQAGAVNPPGDNGSNPPGGNGSNPPGGNGSNPPAGNGGDTQ